jgi:predicted CXXCH cytochrome family protein
MIKYFLVICIVVFSAMYSFAATCTDGGCHEDIINRAELHSPVNDGDCTVCHMAEDDYIAQHAEHPEEYKEFGSPVGEGEILCLMCHEPKNDKKNVHPPVAEGDCTACHDPHGGDVKYFLTGGSESETCFMCHENDKTVKEHVHGPVAVGECSACHDPHSSDNEYRLILPMNQMCLSCHTDKEESLTVSHKHQPVAEDCRTCHNPHNSDFGQLLTNDIKEICFDCHTDIADKVHNSEYVHAPVADDGCSACHNVHGSNNPFILYEYFPETFYNDYKDGLYSLCFQCHDESRITVPDTDDVTGFRNGTRNLHYVHVRMDRKGRSCKACHEVHASSQPLHIRSGVPFGNGGWELPIKFTRNDDGGTCVVGCHKTKSYSRVKAIDNK